MPELLDDLEHPRDDDRSQAKRRLVHQQQAGPTKKRPRDRHLLLLAAGQQAGLLVRALPDHREQVAVLADVRLELICAQRRCAKAQILAHRHVLKEPASLGNERDPGTHDRFRGQRPDVACSELDAAAAARGKPDDRLQRARLAGSVCTEQRDDLAGADHEIEVADGLNRSVGDAQIFD